MPDENKREYRLDALRGAAVVSMVLFHFCYDVFVVLGRNSAWYGQKPAFLWQQSICWSFILIAGYARRFGSRGALRRGLLLNLCGLLVTAVTMLTVPEETVWFGILSFLGCAALLLIPLEKPLGRVPPAAGLALSALLFGLTRHLTEGWIGFGALRLYLPRALYCPLLTPLGLPYPGFRSGDYFPLLPWFCLYLVGWFMHPLLQRSARWRAFAAGKPGPLAWIGRRSLGIYLLHQPLCMALAWLLFR